MTLYLKEYCLTDYNFDKMTNCSYKVKEICLHIINININMNNINLIII